MRNKARLVCKVYAQVEGGYFNEYFALVLRMEENKGFLAYSCIKNFKVYQMDVKSSFLNGDLKEESILRNLMVSSSQENKTMFID